MSTKTAEGAQTDGAQSTSISPISLGGKRIAPSEATIVIEVYTTSTGVEAVATAGTLLLEGLTNQGAFYKELYTFDLTDVDNIYELSGRYVDLKFTPTALDADKTWKAIINSGG